MFCIDSRCTDVHFNLAAEEYLLKRKKENFFMMWQSAPSVVIGKHQCVAQEVDEAYIRENAVVLARRFSGGGAVYHDEGNINLSFIETAERPDFEYYLQQTVEFLETLGIVAYTDKRMGIYVDGQKVSGSAQCIHKDRVMYHCTLLYSTDLQALDAALRGKNDVEDRMPGSRVLRAVPSVRSAVTNISGHLPSALPLKRFARLLFHFFFEGGENRVYRFTPEDLKAVEQLKTEKYAREEWIYDKTVLSPV